VALLSSGTADSAGYYSGLAALRSSGQRTTQPDYSNYSDSPCKSSLSRFDTCQDSSAYFSRKPRSNSSVSDLVLGRIECDLESDSDYCYLQHHHVNSFYYDCYSKSRASATTFGHS